MGDWKSFKGQTPWTVGHEDKPSYNEGDHIANYANAIWSMEEGTNEPVTPIHKPCGYWTKNYVPPPPPFSPLYNNYLIAWYKFNEGTGTDIVNYATSGSSGGGLLPNLILIPNRGTFWTAKTGFGYCVSGASASTHDFVWNKPSRVVGDANGIAFGAFLFPVNTNILGSTAADVITSGIQGGLRPLGTGTALTFNLANGGASSAITVAAASKWFFYFLASDGIFRACQNDGTLLTGAAPNPGTGTATANYLIFGTQYCNADPPTQAAGYRSEGGFGDWILYSGVKLTVSEWGTWYDECRTRYGMAARSGW